MKIHFTLVGAFVWFNFKCFQMKKRWITMHDGGGIEREKSSFKHDECIINFAKSSIFHGKLVIS